MPKKLSIGDLVPDDKNFNKGTEFGDSLIEKSLRENGAGRSILLDKNNNIIAGNKTAQKAGELGMDDVIVVESDGSKIIAVKRTDIDLDSHEGRKLALADNATSKANLNWDEDILKEKYAQEDLTPWGVHLAMGTDDIMEEWEGMPDYNSEDMRAKFSLKVNFNTEADLLAFAELVGQPITAKTKYIYFPKQEKESRRDEGYVTDEE